MSGSIVLFLLAAGGSPALAGVDARIVGEWTGGAPGAQQILRIEANGRCSLGQETGTCQTLRSALLYRGSDGNVVSYGFKVAGDELTISGGGTAPPMVFRRGAAVQRSEARGAPTPAPSPAPVPPQAPGAPAAGRFAHPYWGVSFAVPAGWKTAEREGLVLLGSETEAGLMVARFVRGANRQTLAAEYGQGVKEEGLVLSPTTRAEEFAAGANGGLAGEMAGVATNGARLQARIVGVLSPFGDAAIFMGVTTAEQYAQLKARVDALAAGVEFSQPKTPPANIAVAGQYYYIYTSTSGSSYSREDSLSLCSNGMFGRKGEMYGSQVGQWGVATQSGYAGQWAADGDGRTGTVTLSYRDGRSERLRYEKSGVDIVLNGKKYGRFGDGSCSQKSP